MLQGFAYWPDFRQHIGRPDLASDGVAADVQMRANGYLVSAKTREGTPFELVASPVQVDGESAPTRRAPEVNEHGDDILAELGLDQERVLQLKISGALA